MVQGQKDLGSCGRNRQVQRGAGRQRRQGPSGELRHRAHGAERPSATGRWPGGRGRRQHQPERGKHDHQPDDPEPGPQLELVRHRQGGDRHLPATQRVGRSAQPGYGERSLGDLRHPERQRPGVPAEPGRGGLRFRLQRQRGRVGGLHHGSERRRLHGRPPLAHPQRLLRRSDQPGNPHRRRERLHRALGAGGTQRRDHLRQAGNRGPRRRRQGHPGF